jgi:DNA-binding NtrC family response regulator
MAYDRTEDPGEEPPASSQKYAVGRILADAERSLILETLDRSHGNRAHSARLLGISIRTLRNKLNQYAAEGANIPPPASGQAA